MRLFDCIIIFFFKLSLLGRDPDPAGEAVNQVHGALFSGAGAAQPGLGQQVAAAARAGDAFSGRTAKTGLSLTG